LALIQLTAASVVDSKERHDAVDNKEAVLVANEELGNLVQELHLVLRVDGTSVCDVVLCYALSGDMAASRLDTLTGLWIDTKALSNLSDPLRSKGTFRICGTMSER